MNPCRCGTKVSTIVMSRSTASQGVQKHYSIRAHVARARPRRAWAKKRLRVHGNQEEAGGDEQVRALVPGFRMHDEATKFLSTGTSSRSRRRRCRRGATVTACSGPVCSTTRKYNADLLESRDVTGEKPCRVSAHSDGHKRIGPLGMASLCRLGHAGQAGKARTALGINASKHSGISGRFIDRARMRAALRQRHLPDRQDV